MLERYSVKTPVCMDMCGLSLSRTNRIMFFFVFQSEHNKMFSDIKSISLSADMLQSYPIKQERFLGTIFREKTISEILKSHNFF